MTQPALAAKTGIHQPRLSQYENGKVSPSPETLARILDALQVRPSIRLEAAQDEVREVAKQFHVDALWVFGSCVQGTDTPESDVDLVVKFDDSASTYDHANLIATLEESLGVEVDVVSADIPTAARFLDGAERI